MKKKSKKETGNATRASVKKEIDEGRARRGIEPSRWANGAGSGMKGQAAVASASSSAAQSSLGIAPGYANSIERAS